ncbi:MAG: hypothetical protein WA775_02850 [Psychroserpens sp.]|uniref:hypothetical protein n=1 Tax=Psychroserpens sp. TaxID=2020870 RepID=UPI003CBE3EEF
MYAHQNHILSIPAKLLYKEWNLITYNTYKSHCKRRKLIRTKEGRGPGNEAYVSFYDLPIDIKRKCVEELGDPKEVVVRNILEDYLLPDIEANRFFAQHRKPNGKALTTAEQRERASGVMVFNAIREVISDNAAFARAFGRKKTKMWQNIAEAVNMLDSDRWPFNLPGNPRSLRSKFDKYLEEDYWAFIHGNEGKKNALKANDLVEKLIVSLYCLPNKPYANSTHEDYIDFINGNIDVLDIQTGEVMERMDFYKNGLPIEISESTVRNILNKPKNQLLIKKYRDGSFDFHHKERPHVNRTKAQFSMSKISLDDRDIMHTKLNDGTKVKAYYAYDTMSTAMIGKSHSKTKDHELYLDCIRDMFRFTTNLGLGVPMQMEVEHHLVKDFRDGLMKAGNMFPFVRWCNPTNSQEKRAERFIGAKKYGVEKDNNQNVGRHYSRRASNRITRQKIFDEENDNYKFAKASYKEIVAQELQEQIEYNNELHPDQKQFKGLSRLDVFIQNVNPDLPDLDRAQLARYVGLKRDTSIRRNQYVVVQYGKYQLESPHVLDRLANNDLNVTAYYLPNEENEVDEVFIYQNDQLICECKPAPTFNEANAEWTDDDVQGYKDATKYISSFDKKIKDDTSEQLSKLTIMKKRAVIEDDEPIIIPTLDVGEAFNDDDYDDYDANDMDAIRRRALEEL